jgi:hypothetical protein
MRRNRSIFPAPHVQRLKRDQVLLDLVPLLHVQNCRVHVCDMRFNQRRRMYGDMVIHEQTLGNRVTPYSCKLLLLLVLVVVPGNLLGIARFFDRINSAQDDHHRGLEENEASD